MPNVGICIKKKNLQGKNTYEVWKHALFRFISYLIIKRIDIYVCIHSVQSLSHVRLFATTWTAAHQASLSITNSRSLLRLMSVESVMSSSADDGDTILSSVIPFFSCLQSFLASGSFPMSQFFESGGQSTGVSGLASVLPMNIQD